MHRRTRKTLLSVAAVLVLLAVAVFLRSKAPPEAARLLPESDGILYVNLKPFRAFFHKQLKPPDRVPEYQEFVDATGIDWEQDLDQAAIALHRMQDPNGPNGPVAYSMVLVGRLTGKRLNSWLDAHAASREIYAGHTIYNVPSEGRTVRVVQIGYDTLAVSNTPTPEQIHSIIDRHRTAALPFAGSTLLSHHYHEVPLLSFAWGIGQIGLPFSESGAIKVFGISLPLQDGAIFVASITPTLPLAGMLKAARRRARAQRSRRRHPGGQFADARAARAQPRGRPRRHPGQQRPQGSDATAEVSQKHDRVVVTGTFSPASLASLASATKNSAHAQ